MIARISLRYFPVCDCFPCRIIKGIMKVKQSQKSVHFQLEYEIIVPDLNISIVKVVLSKILSVVIAVVLEVLGIR